MNLHFKSTKLTRVSDIEIPSIFSRRLRTGINKIDVLFDEGILPGSASTLTAQAGCGKTTFMLQMLHGLDKNGYNVGYFSGEESIYQLAYTANRVNSTRVPVANITDIDEIKEMMKDLDVLVVDSFQALTVKQKMNSRQLEKYAVQTLTRRAKETECAVIFIMHLTKSGDLKGGTIVPHTVDCNIKIERLTDTDDESARIIYFEKNRFGPLNELECTIGRAGYDFDATVVREDDKAKNKKSRGKDDDIAKIESYLADHGEINISGAVQLIGDVNKAYTRLREMTIVGKLEKTGRGTDATWTSVEETVVAFAAEKR